MTTESAPSTTKPVADWAQIEACYRAGIQSLRQIADAHGLSEGAIRKRAKKEDWERDLKAKIQARAEALVRKEAVRSEVRAASAISEKEVIDANANAVVQVTLGQRKDVQRSRSIVMRLMDELELQAGPENADLLAQLGDLMRKEDDKGQDRLNDLYQKIVSLPGRAKTMKDLGESLRVLIALERQAFGLDDKDNAPVDALTSLLHGIANSNGNAFQPVARDPEHDED